MKLVVEHVKPREPIPEDQILNAKVLAIKGIKKKYGDEEEDRVEFRFRITTPGVWEDQKISGDVPLNFNDGERNRLRQWSEILAGYEMPLGYELETDDLVGRDIRIVVGARFYKDRNGEEQVWNSVEDLLPAEEPF
jgi:hypothetical protein